jgi:hypothetical protein
LLICLQINEQTISRSNTILKAVLPEAYVRLPDSANPTLMGSTVALGPARFRPPSPIAKLSALGDNSPSESAEPELKSHTAL